MAAPHRMAAVPDSRARDDNVARLRVPPQSREAEQAVLGGLLQDNAAFAAASELVTDADFFGFEHRLIFAAIADLIEDGITADVITVYERLQVNGKAEDCGGLAYLNSLHLGVPSAAGIRSYAGIVRERAMLRKLIAASDEIATAAFNTQGRAAADVIAEGFAKVRAIAAEAPDSKALPLLSFDQLRAEAQAVSWTVKHVLPADSVGLLFGASGTFKTYIAIDAAMHVVHGLKWLGRRTKKGPALFIAGEGGTGLAGRIEAWHRARRLPAPPASMLRVIPVALDLGADAWRVADAAKAAGIEPSIVVVDTFSQTFSGEENSANEVAAYFREVGNHLRALWHCTVLVIHHSGHSATDRPRGSSSMQANTSFLLGAFRDEKEMLATLTCVHMKDGRAFDDAIFQVNVQQLGTDADGDQVTQLVARHLSSAEEVQDAMAAEHKAGRGGHNQLIVSLAHNGMKEAELRKAFYEDCAADTTDGRRQAYFRARKWAIEKQFFEIAKGIVIVTEPEKRT